MLAEIMAGNASRGADRRASSSRCARRGRPSTSSPGLAAHDARAGHARAARARRPRRHRRHRRRAPDLQRVDDRGADRRRRRLRAWPSTATARPRACRARADVLEALGARIDLAPEARGAAASTRPASASCSPPPTTRRRASSSRCARSSPCARSSTSSGPLTNPAGRARASSSASPTPPTSTRSPARWRGWGVDRALVVSSEDGLDEMSTSAPTQVVEVNGERIERYDVAPGDVGLEPSAARRRRRRDAARRTPAITRAILAGEAGPRARPGGAQRRRRDLRARPRRHARARASTPPRGAIDSGAARARARRASSR